MTAKFFAILTNQGAARLANAAALGTKLNLTQMAVGDANGKLPTPDPAQTKLINQKRIAPLNRLSVDPKNTSQIIAEQIIPENEGGWWIREIGLYDDAGVLIAVANCPETYKPLLQEGSGRTQTIRMLLIVSSAAAITLKIDPAVVLATRQYVDDGVIEVKAYTDKKLTAHEQSRNHPDGTLAAKGFVQLNSSVESTSEQLAATPKAVKITMDNANARLAKERNLADLPNPALARQNLSLGDSATKSTGKTAGTVAAGDDPRIVGAVQNTRKINGKLLTEDVTITSQDIFNDQSLPIGENKNLNDYKTPGLYHQILDKNATLALNYPEALAGALSILRTAGVKQIYHINNSSRVWSRSFYGGNWTVWSRVYDTENKPTASELGFVPSSGGGMRGTLNQDAVPSETYLQTAISNVTEKGTKNYLRKMRGSLNAHIWHETVQENEYRLSVGATDSRDILSLSVDNGAKFSGEVISTNGNGLRIARGGYGAFFRNDGTYFYLMMTNKGDEFGGFNSLRPLEVNLGTGEILAGKLRLADYSHFDGRYLKRAEMYPVGAPIPWPQSAVPAGFLLCNGQAFNKATYSLLATAYPSGVLPDLRGEFIRGLDAGRGVDSGRTVLSAQGDAIRNITGTFSGADDNRATPAITLSGAFYDTGKTQGTDKGGETAQPIIAFDSSRVVPTANENRPRNVAFSYIVRAA